MFTMMNQARLAVALQGVGIAERATQQALAYARERKQGRAAGVKDGMSPIITHPDVKRMLLTMRALTGAARAISYATAVAIDRAHRSTDEKARAAANERASLLTPIAKAFGDRCRLRGLLARRAGAWRHGLYRGDRRGAALPRRAYRRDLRRHQRHPGDRPRHPQAADVGRRTPCARYIGELRRTADAVKAANDPAFGATGARLADAIDSLERATAWLLKDPQSEAALAGATPYLRLFANAAGGALLAEQALAAARMASDGSAPARIALARFFAENIAVSASRTRTHRHRRRYQRECQRGGIGVNGLPSSLRSD